VFKRLIVGILAIAFLAGLVPALALAAPDEADLQRQITELREKLEKLESRLEATSGQQKKAATGEKIQFSGYIQARYTDKEGSAGNFNVARSRLKMKGHITERSTFTLQIDARSKDGKVDLRDAYVDRWLGSEKGRYIRVGQTKVPILYEVLESSSVRLSPERTAIARAMFPGERDVGLLMHCARPGKPTFDLGLVNGQGRNKSDANNHKDIFARVLLSVGNGTASVGYYDGEFTSGAVTTDKTRFVIGTEHTLGKVGFRAEYVSGENLGSDIAGWYAQAAVPVKQGVNTLFVRYDVYDEDRDAANRTFKRATFGLEHRLDAKSRLTFAFESRSADAGFTNVASDGEAVDGNAVTLQYQVKYG